MAGTESLAKDDGNVAPGTVIAGRYEVLEVLGRGGMGFVYAARHRALDKRVALKLLRPGLVRDPQASTRFLREARAAAGIRSPHVVSVNDFGTTDDGRAFIVMELLEGRDLARVLREEGRLATGRAVGIARQIARGLIAAHEAGIVHRDLKTENVFVTVEDGRELVKLLDFGISRIRAFDQQERLTTSGMIIGTPSYMSPEQAVGETEVDERADIYALGVLLYEMLAGRVPFHGRSPVVVVYKHVHEAPAPLRGQPDVTPALEAVVLRALAKDPAARFPTARAMLDALPDPTALPGGDLVVPVNASAPLPATEARSSHTPADSSQKTVPATAVVAPTVIAPAVRREKKQKSDGGPTHRTALEPPVAPSAQRSRWPHVMIAIVPIALICAWIVTHAIVPKMPEAHRASPAARRTPDPSPPEDTQDTENHSARVDAPIPVEPETGRTDAEPTVSSVRAVRRERVLVRGGRTERAPEHSVAPAGPTAHAPTGARREIKRNPYVRRDAGVTGGAP